MDMAACHTTYSARRLYWHTGNKSTVPPGVPIQALNMLLCILPQYSLLFLVHSQNIHFNNSFFYCKYLYFKSTHWNPKADILGSNTFSSQCARDELLRSQLFTITTLLHYDIGYFFVTFIAYWSMLVYHHKAWWSR